MTYKEEDWVHWYCDHKSDGPSQKVTRVRFRSGGERDPRECNFSMRWETLGFASDIVAYLPEKQSEKEEHTGPNLTGRIVSPLDKQEGGDHYKNLKIQPVEYILANGLGFCEGSVIKYVTRHEDKGGVQDLRKAIHFLEILISDIEKKNVQS